MNRYLFLVSLNYAFPILRPLQKAIRERGDQVAWFIDNPGCRKFLREDEKELTTVQEVMEYNPAAVFTPGNDMYDFFPGVKVQVFHGFNIDKRPGVGDHYRIKGWFDLYCVNDVSATETFRQLAQNHGNFKVAETGWCKIDGFFGEDGKLHLPANPRPVILYCSTFTKWITSTPHLFDQIERLVREKDWEWLITFHPLMAPDIVEKYKGLESKYPNVKFIETDNNVELLKKADVMLCDSSSIIYEFLYFDKPVVTFKNTAPGDHLIDISEPEKLGPALETALQRPDDLMGRIRKKMDMMHPMRDGHSSQRILAAVDDFIANDLGKLKKKRISLDRRFKARKRLGYFPLWEKIKRSFAGK